MNPAKTECEELMNALLLFEEQMLQKNIAFSPYSGAIKPNGEIINIAAYDGREQPRSQDFRLDEYPMSTTISCRFAGSRSNASNGCCSISA